MFNLKKIFKFKKDEGLEEYEFEIPKHILKKIRKDENIDDSDDMPNIERCPKCNSDQVEFHIISDELKGIKRTRTDEYIGCKRVTSGISKNICGDCKYEWDEKEINSPGWVNFG